MHRIADWARYHQTDIKTVQTVLKAHQTSALLTFPIQWNGIKKAGQTAHRLGTKDQVFLDYVIPALCGALDPHGVHHFEARLRRTEIRDLATTGYATPHVDHTYFAENLSIAMTWTGSINDLMTLSHEAGHVAHILLSKAVAMPPIGRETCAFLAELLVLHHLQDHAPDLFDAACTIWHAENDIYLRDDLNHLTQSLIDPDTPYEYRQNYPIARLAAVHLFDAEDPSVIRDLFASGPDAMTHIALAQMANAQNPLPVFPKATSPAQEAYQSLGAMVLLDMAAGEDKAESTISAYYAELLNHMQHQTAFVGLDANNKPFGYTTWANGQTKDRASTHETTPFGSADTLRSILKAHLEHHTPAKSEEVA